MVSKDIPLRGEAGAGAKQQAEWAHARVEKLQHELASAQRRQESWQAGAEGERLIGCALAQAGWPVLHDQRWPGRTKANIDHLVFASDRIWMIDAKHWSGRIHLTDDHLRQNGNSRNTHLEKASRASFDVRRALGPSAPPVEPILCLTKSGRDLTPTAVDGVLVVGLDHLQETLGQAPHLGVELALYVQQVPQLLSAPLASLGQNTSTMTGAHAKRQSKRPRRTADLRRPATRPTKSSRAKRRNFRRSKQKFRLLQLAITLMLLYWLATSL